MAYTDLGAQPITEAAPAGTDLSGEPLYDRLTAEIKKLSSPTAEGGIDWQVIERLAAEILATKSKHVLVACCLNIALQHTSGWRGFAEGTAILRDLLLTYWDSCFPVKKRMRGRRNAIVWWQEMIEGLITASEGEQWDRDARTALLATLEEIDTFLGEHMEDAPVLRTTIQAVGTHITELVVDEPETEPEPAAAAPAISPPAPTSAGAPPPPSPSPVRKMEAPAPAEELPAEKNLARGCDYLRLTATQLLQNDPFHPLAYRLNRIIAWFPVDTLPPASDGITMLPPPDGQVVSALGSLAAGGDWSGLLQAAEQQVRGSLFWLDLHRYVATALERLGHDLAGAGVACETLLLIKRLPGLDHLAFSDGTPFADRATRDWLNELRRDGRTEDRQAAAADREAEVSGQAAKARALAEQNRLAEGLSLLHQGLQTAVGGRSRLQWSLAICRLLCRSRQPLVAEPFAEAILAELDRHHLERWEPKLAEEALVAVCEVLGLLDKEEAGRNRLRTVLGRLALLNPARALERQ